jgi:hypothetical protein
MKQVGGRGTSTVASELSGWAQLTVAPSHTRPSTRRVRSGDSVFTVPGWLSGVLSIMLR